MRIKQWICLVLAAVMTLAITACGKTTPAQSAQSSQSAEGEKIKLVIGVPSAANVLDWEDNAYTQWLEEQSGYDIEVMNFSVDSSEWKTQLITMVAGGDPLPDMFVDANAMPRELKDDGYFVDLADYFNDENNADAQGYIAMLKKNLEPSMFDRVMAEGYDGAGHWYGFPMLGTEETACDMLYINKVWLDKLGLAMPRTWDEFIDVLTAFRDKDPNGNGKPDEIPMMGAAGFMRSNTPNWIITNFLWYHMSHCLQPDENGQLQFQYFKDEFRQALRTGREMYDNKLLSELTWTIKANSELCPTYTPVEGLARCGIITGYPTVTCTPGSEILYEYVPLPPLEGACASIHPVTHYFQNYIFKTCEHPEAAFRLYCIMASPEGSIRSSRGEYGVDWEWGKDYKTGYTGIKVLNPDALTGQTRSTWGRNSVTSGWAYDPAVDEGKKDICGFTVQTEPPGEDQKWELYAAEISEEIHKLNVAWSKEHDPKNVVLRSNLAYTTEEDERQGGARSDIYYYVNQSIAEFMTGIRDINDDAEWEKFKDTIWNELNGKTHLEVSQAAYERYLAHVAEAQ